MIDTSHLDKIPKWDNFAVLTDITGDRIPVVRVDSWRQFASILDDEYFNRSDTQLVFRGHRRYDWGLTPSLGRLDPRGIITKEVADTQLKLFRRAVRGRLSDSSVVNDGEEEELWSVGQHHGLKTPLLDWTYSPFVALFFAFEKQDGESPNPYRVIYVLNKSYVEREDLCPGIRVLEPRKDDHGRLVNQAGLFTLSDYENTLENFLINSLHDEALAEVADEDEAYELAKYICKIYIANKDRENCLRHLRRMNVHHASLFPDLLGASEYCNILIAESNNVHSSKLDEKAVEETLGEEKDGNVLEETLSKEKESTEKDEKPLEETSSTEKESTEKDEKPLEEFSVEILEDLLLASLGPQAESYNIPSIAKESFDIFKTNQVPDWDKRVTVQATLRNKIRSLLRNHGYPPIIIDLTVDEMLRCAQEKMKDGENEQ